MTVDLGLLGHQNIPSTVLIVLGLSVVAYQVLIFIRVVLSIFVLPGKSIRSFGAPGTWAVITGASDGIGKEFAHQIAKQGYNLLLVSRTASKLSTLREGLRKIYPDIQIETLAIDFSAAQASDYDSLAAHLDSKQISILINNVGQSHSIPVPFLSTPTPELTSIIQINCLTTLRVTQLVLPHMIPQHRGLILTMGSFGGMIPTPLLATYSGSKAFLQQWSNALASELRNEGITVHFIHAHLVTSAMSKIRRASLLVPSEKAFVRSVLSKIGRRGGSVGFTHSGSPYWSHALMASAITGLLGTYSEWLLEYNRKMHVGIRKRALAKAERDKAKGKKES